LSDAKKKRPWRRPQWQRGESWEDVQESGKGNPRLRGGRNRRVALSDALPAYLLPAALFLSVRQVIDEERRSFIIKLLVTLRGARPRTLRGAARRRKQMGEASRVLPARHKSAEPVKAGQEGTSDPSPGPASMSVMVRATEPMAEAPLRVTSPTRKWVRRSKDLRSAGSLLRDANRRRPNHFGRQSLGKPARPKDQIPHGVESAPTTDERELTEPENPTPASQPDWVGMIEATDERENGGRSLVVVRGRENRPHGEGRQWI
jgi:hypothetical protein